MKFYDCLTAPSPRRVRMFIKEKNLEIETINLDLRKSEQMQEWFSDINPRNTVPAFVTKERNILFHSLSICVYLEKVFEEINLLGHTAEEQALIINSINDVESNLVLNNSYENKRYQTKVSRNKKSKLRYFIKYKLIFKFYTFVLFLINLIKKIILLRF